jgi:hypothetical protein
MKTEPKLYPVHDLLKFRESNLLRVNSEYQRGAVWSEAQKKKLVDSVLRGYPIPLFYLHVVSNKVGPFGGNWLEIIDGQQRLNALDEFLHDGFALFDPIKDDKQARFPNFIKDVPCPWGRKTFSQLEADDKARFLNTSLHIVEIVTDNPNEARDLFIRLQAGLPLNSQEKRDAWPGHLTELVLRLGGKAGLVGKTGHDFFRKFVANTGTDRGKGRQLCAQLLMLFSNQREHREDWPDIGSRALDEFYYKNLDFELHGKIATRFQAVLDKAADIFGGTKRIKPLKGHEAIGVILLIDSLMDDYTRGWEDQFVDALLKFRQCVLQDKASRNSSEPGNFWKSYDALTRVDSDRGATIRARHAFFSLTMVSFLSSVMKLKDESRIFGEIERELIFIRAGRKCAACDGVVSWDDHEIHHVDPHSKGGPTNLSNGALVHKKCHPKSAEDVAKLKAAIEARAKEQ